MDKTLTHSETTPNAQSTTPAPSTANTHYTIQEYRIEQLEKQLANINAQTKTAPTIGVSVADMNQMYSNHLHTIDLILGVVAFFILLAGGVFGWIGYPQILKMIQRNVDENVETATKSAIETAVEPLRKEYKNLLAEQEKQEKQIEEQNKQIQSEHHLAQAYRAYDEDKYKEALLHYDKAIELDPNSTYAYISRSATHVHLKQYDAAITNSNKALELDPKSTYAYYNKACAYSLLKKPASETLYLLKKSIELDEKHIQMAREDDDFKSLRKNPKFRKLVGLDDEE